MRTIQERVIERVGSSKPIPIDVRLISATNRDLSELVAKKEFREDLYYRLKVFQIDIPPLRERRLDIPVLADSFIERFNRLDDRDARDVATKVMQHIDSIQQFHCHS